jgi:hypothetical protein
MKTKKTLHLPSPCSEPWSNMHPNTEGRHCDTCDKTVVDFTAKTDEEIYHYLSNSPGQVCGRFRTTQIATTPLYRKWAGVLSLSLAAGLMPLQMAAQTAPLKMASFSQKNILLEKQIWQIQGSVLCEEKLEPLPFASVAVYVNDQLITGTESDLEGWFTIALPQ